MLHNTVTLPRRRYTTRTHYRHLYNSTQHVIDILHHFIFSFWWNLKNGLSNWIVRQRSIGKLITRMSIKCWKCKVGGASPESANARSAPELGSPIHLWFLLKEGVDPCRHLFVRAYLSYDTLTVGGRSHICNDHSRSRRPVHMDHITHGANAPYWLYLNLTSVQIQPDLPQPPHPIPTIKRNTHTILHPIPHKCPFAVKKWVCTFLNRVLALHFMTTDWQQLTCI